LGSLLENKFSRHSEWTTNLISPFSLFAHRLDMMDERNEGMFLSSRFLIRRKSSAISGSAKLFRLDLEALYEHVA
jgi:hypothetical protein